MKKLFHVLDSFAVVAGASLIVASVLGIGEAQAAVGAALAIPMGGPWGGAAGAVLATMPITRRVAYSYLCDPRNVAEFRDMGTALTNVGLALRVAGANLHLGNLDDEEWSIVYPDPKTLWDYLGPAYQIPHLRAQMHPIVRQKTEEAGRTMRGLPMAA